MLKKIPKILPPDLVKILMEMGHGDSIVLADGNFPSHRIGQRVVRCDAIGVPPLLDAILELMPLDAYSENQVGLMKVVDGDPVVPVIWDEYKTILKKHEPDNSNIEWIERFQFYEEAKKAFAVVATGEEAIYANIILKKGVVQ